MQQCLLFSIYILCLELLYEKSIEIFLCQSCGTSLEKATNVTSVANSNDTVFTNDIKLY